MHNVDTYSRLLPVVALKDLRNVASALRRRVAGLRAQKIRAGRVSDAWRAQHARDAVKR